MSAVPQRPPTVKGPYTARRVDLDVREEVRTGREPFSRIMAAASALEPGQALVIRASFEPFPLYRALGQRGFAYWTERRAADDWSVWFYPRLLTIDVRELEPPEPMLRVLDALESLAPGQHLEVRHNRRPIFLYPQLEERGYTHETDEPEKGIVRIVIRRREETPG